MDLSAEQLRYGGHRGWSDFLPIPKLNVGYDRVGMRLGEMDRFGKGVLCGCADGVEVLSRLEDDVPGLFLVCRTVSKKEGF